MTTGSPRDFFARRVRGVVRAGEAGTVLIAVSFRGK
jgi:hypothetical protein